MNHEKIKNKTEGYLGIAKSFEEYYLVGRELENIGKLIQDMAFHIGFLQAKVDDQTEELSKLKNTSNVEENLSQIQTQTEKVEAVEKLLKILKIAI